MDAPAGGQRIYWLDQSVSREGAVAYARTRVRGVIMRGGRARDMAW